MPPDLQGTRVDVEQADTEKKRMASETAVFTSVGRDERIVASCLERETRHLVLKSEGGMFAWRRSSMPS